MKLSDVTSVILKKGIREYKYSNSKIKPIGHTADGKKGAIFGFRTKELMTESRGVVLTSQEALTENEDKFTHWTPNVYSYGAYADDNRTIVKGHNERNLRQINTFVIDFDRSLGEILDSQMILDAAIDLELMPTLILETPGGFQAYFILETAWFISSKNNYQSIEVAKRVSENLRKAFAEVLPSVDLGCNHFGIARIPRTDNVVYYYPALTHDMQQLIQWSMKFEPKRTHKKPNLNVVAIEMNQIKEQWVKTLIDNPQIVGTKGKLGRNNVIFTLSLAYYASKIEQERCFDDMDVFNSSLNYPLTAAEVKRIVKSAYSGKYQGASKAYVQELVMNWGLESLSEEKMFTQQRNTWYKFKKERHERKQSHLSEWKEDILAYLETQCYRYRPEVSLTKTDLQAAITFNGQSIPKRSLDRALKELTSEGKLFVQVKAGRGGGIVVATRKALIRTVIQVKQQVKAAYKQGIKTFFKEADMLVKLFEQPSKNSKKQGDYRQLNLWNTG